MALTPKTSSRSQFCTKCHFTWSHARSWGERYERRYVLTVLRREQVQQVCQNNIVMSCPKCKCANGNGAKVWNDIECQPCDRWVSCPGCLLPFIHCMLGQQSHDPGSKKRDVWLDKNNHCHVSFSLSLRSHTKQLLIWMNIIVQHLPHSMELPILLSKIIIWLCYAYIDWSFTRLCCEPVKLWSIHDWNHFCFSSFGGVNQLSSKWGIQAVGQPCVLTAEAQTAVFFSFSYERVLCSCSQLSWEIIIMAFYLSSPIPWSVDAEEATKGGSRESTSEMACGPKMSCHCPPSSLSLALSLFFPACLGCLPFSLALITAFVNCVSEPK